ncbi:hypothetical protein JBE04_05680 [Streptomyces sp. PRKS01-29]|nr:hypothetical protein [Streptomyces sabulosicollis]MBI0293991.1 hypothetical protein [Streptomyces sabulosicollis]
MAPPPAPAPAPPPVPVLEPVGRRRERPAQSSDLHSALHSPSIACRVGQFTRLADLYQSPLDWDHPAGPSPWPREQRESFRGEVDAALEALRRELGDGWTVEDRRSYVMPGADKCA